MKATLSLLFVVLSVLQTQGVSAQFDITTSLLSWVAGPVANFFAPPRKIYVRNRKTDTLFEEEMVPDARTLLSFLNQYPGYLNYPIVKTMLTKQTVNSRLKMDSPDLAQSLINSFLKKLPSINMTEFKWEYPENYTTFNEFFYRALKPGARPVANPTDPRTLVSAADARLAVYDSVSIAKDIWIKGKNFTIPRMLDDEELAKQFVKGSLAIFRLAPQDYHRFHSPVNGVVVDIREINGEYYSVNPMIVCSEINVFTENRRSVALIQSPEFGLVAFVAVGASLVGSINYTGLVKGAKITRGQELGYFAYGGSTIVVLFQEGKVKFDIDLLMQSSAAVETLVQVGENVGKI